MRVRHSVSASASPSPSFLSPKRRLLARVFRSPMRSSATGRIRFLSVGIAVVALILIGRLYSVQIMQGDFYAEQADRQYVRTDQNLFDRGSIFFQDKEGLLIAAATTKTGFSIIMNPTKVSDPEALF